MCGCGVGEGNEMVCVGGSVGSEAVRIVGGYDNENGCVCVDKILSNPRHVHVSLFPRPSLLFFKACVGG